MVYSWQYWLSRRPTQRTKWVQDATVFGPEDAILYDFPNHNGNRAVRETHYLSKKIVRDGKSGPPLHIHLRQKETFLVEQGVLGVVKNGVEYAVKKGDGPVSVPPGISLSNPPDEGEYRHSFWAHSSNTEDLIFKVWVEPQDLDHGFDESFMRNFSGYVRDCERQKIPPSLFQILLFLYDSDIVLTPPFWTPILFLMALHHVLAYWVGARLLGYSANYPEYSNLRK